MENREMEPPQHRSVKHIFGNSICPKYFDIPGTGFWPGSARNRNQENIYSARGAWRVFDIQGEGPVVGEVVGFVCDCDRGGDNVEYVVAYEINCSNWLVSRLANLLIAFNRLKNNLLLQIFKLIYIMLLISLSIMNFPILPVQVIQVL